MAERMVLISVVEYENLQKSINNNITEIEEAKSNAVLEKVVQQKKPVHLPTKKLKKVVARKPVEEPAVSPQSVIPTIVKKPSTWQSWK